jgi:hypothetical protein
VARRVFGIAFIEKAWTEPSLDGTDSWTFSSPCHHSNRRAGYTGFTLWLANAPSNWRRILLTHRNTDT